MSLRLDRETRALLGLRNPWPKMLALAIDRRVSKQHRDRVRMAALRLSAAVKQAEASYQRNYAATPAGREARLRAQRAYRARLKKAREGLWLPRHCENDTRGGSGHG